MGINLGLLLVVLSASGRLDLLLILDEIRIKQDVPGISAVVTQNNEVVFSGASGIADIETGRKMTADTVLYAGSLTKILTAVLTLQLVDDGKLSLDDLVPGIAARASTHGTGIKVAHLLAHTSGLRREGNFDYWFSADFPGPADLAEYLSKAPVDTAPGEAFRYSNVGYAAIGPVIARASGESYDQALAQRVLQPLGMTSSGTLKPGDELAAGYSPVNRVLPNADRPFAGLGSVVGDRRLREYHNAKAMTPAFGAYTSVHDLSRLARMLLGFGHCKVLSESTRSQLLSVQAGDVQGLGIRVTRFKGRPVARHGGWFAAHRSHLLLDLSSGIAVVVMANSDSASPDKVAEILLERVLANVENETD